MSNKEEKGKTKSICKKVNFTLVVTLHYDDKTTDKLKSHFNSKPIVGGCNLPLTKDFTKAYRKLMKGYKNSLSKKSNSKIINRDTQIFSTVEGNTACSQCGCAPGAVYPCGVKCNAPSAGSLVCSTDNNCCFKK